MSNEVATTQREPAEIVKLATQLEQRIDQIKMALPSHITPEKFQRTIITACQSDPELLQCDRPSLVLACMKAAQDGLLPDKREAAIVVFKENKKQADGSWQSRKIATYMPMVYGLRKKILQTNEVVSLEVSVVYRAEVEAGKFLYEVGLQPPLRHRPMLELSEEQSKDSEIVAAYSIATMADGTKSYELMRRFEIDRVRETSKTGATKDRNGKPRESSGPWKDWFPEMAKKTVMRRHAKTLPQSGDIIIDVEGQEHDASRSTLNLLESQQADAPMIEQRDDALPPHDEETGELIEGDGTGQALPEVDEDPAQTEREAGQQQEPIEAEGRKKAPSKPKAKAKPEPEKAQDPEPVTQSESDPEPGSEGEATAEEAEEEALEAGAQSIVDDDGDTGAINDWEVVADDLISSLKAATTIIDLNRVYEESEESRSQMPEQISSVVESAYQIEKRRLRGS